MFHISPLLCSSVSNFKFKNNVACFRKSVSFLQGGITICGKVRDDDTIRPHGPMRKAVSLSTVGGRGMNEDDTHKALRVWEMNISAVEIIFFFNHHTVSIEIRMFVNFLFCKYRSPSTVIPRPQSVSSVDLP